MGQGDTMLLRRSQVAFQFALLAGLMNAGRHAIDLMPRSADQCSDQRFVTT